jgi:ubiquitin carboxyl-terminal hydrolase L5
VLRGLFKNLDCRIDGLRGGPIVLGDVTNDWLAVAKPAIEQRMMRYAATETHFALLSIRPKRSSLIESELATLQTVLDALTAEDDSSNAEEIENIRTQIIELRSKLDDETATLERQRQENIRRRHNYVPFIVSLLKVLSQKGHLNDLVAKAKDRKRNSQNARKGTASN